MGPPKQHRPEQRLEAANDCWAAVFNSVSLGADVLGELDALAAHVDGAFVVVVKVTGGHYRRRCYLTAAAAENAARKATDRGENAVVYLAELKPLWRIVGGER